MKNENRVDLCDVINQEIDDRIRLGEKDGMPIELDEERRSFIVHVIDKYLGEQLEEQVTNALY